MRRRIWSTRITFADWFARLSDWLLPEPSASPRLSGSDPWPAEDDDPITTEYEAAALVRCPWCPERMEDWPK